MNIKNLVEGERGCGFRKEGGLYLMGGAGGSACCKLPFPLTVCPCCGGGIKFGRGFGWINTDLFQDGQPCSMPGTELIRDAFPGMITNKAFDDLAQTCIVNKPGQRIGLMWVGHKYYTPETFTKEARQMGISKRISQLPRGIKPGETWIALAHKKAFTRQMTAENGTEFTTIHEPGIFMVFKLTSIQYVVHEGDGDDYLETLEKKGIELVTVQHAGQQSLSL